MSKCDLTLLPLTIKIDPEPDVFVDTVKIEVTGNTFLLISILRSCMALPVKKDRRIQKVIYLMNG